MWRSGHFGKQSPWSSANRCMVDTHNTPPRFYIFICCFLACVRVIIPLSLNDCFVQLDKDELRKKLWDSLNFKLGKGKYLQCFTCQGYLFPNSFSRHTVKTRLSTRSIKHPSYEMIKTFNKRPSNPHLFFEFLIYSVFLITRTSKGPRN